MQDNRLNQGIATNWSGMTSLSKPETGDSEDALFVGIPSFVDREALAIHINRSQNGLHAIEFEAFYEEFVSDSDRAAVVLGAAKIDDILARILSARLVRCVDEKSDELLNAFRLGLISKEFRRSLHLIRKIRNTFAHDL